MKRARLTEQEIKEALRSYANKNIEMAKVKYGPIGAFLYDGRQIELWRDEDGSMLSEEFLPFLWDIEAEWYDGVDTYVEEFWHEFYCSSDAEWEGLDDSAQIELLEEFQSLKD